MKSAHRKSKSLIDRKLSVEARDMFFAAAEKMNLDDAAALLEREFDVKLSAKSVGLWLGERRTRAAIERQDEQFQTRLLEIAASSKSAEELIEKIGASKLIGEANASLISQAYMSALLSKDTKEIEKMAAVFANTIHAVTARDRVEVSKFAAETQREKVKADLTKKIDLGLQEVYAQLRGTTQGEEVIRQIQAIVGAA